MSSDTSEIEPQNSSAQDDKGRFRKGVSGNPGGQPKWLRKLRKDLIAGAPDAAKLLIGLMRGDIKNLVTTEDGTVIEVDPHMKERLKAAELWLAYMVPKPKQEVEATVNAPARALPGWTKEELLELVRAGESDSH